MREQQRYQHGRPAPEAGVLERDACPGTIPDRPRHDGDVVSTGTVRILGRLEGDIRADRIVVAGTATVDGVLLARTVHVDGTVNGPIIADRVTLGPTARIKGNISYETVNIAAGASIVGYCLDRTRQEPAKAGRDAALALPFNRVWTTRGKPPVPASQAGRSTAPRTSSMKAVWRAYQEGRTSG
jgi:cytoskeletal protein CcmA (bactofilin family)